jgi:hypothetical protein
MKKNMGTTDRSIRILLAIVILVLYINGTLTGSAAITLGIVGLIMIVTGLTGYCLLYIPFKFSTLKGNS